MAISNDPTSMSPAQRLLGVALALAIGLGLAWAAWTWLDDPEPRRAQRAVEEAMVRAASDALRTELGAGDWQIVDPLNPNRVAGKTFIYPVDGGWEVSGHYRLAQPPEARTASGGPWSGWLVRLDENGNAIQISTQTPRSTPPGE